MDDETQLNQTKRTYFIGSLILVLIVLAGFVMYLKNGMKTSTEKKVEVTAVAPTSYPATGSFSVVSEAQTTTVGAPTKATIFANTEGKDLVGYDLLFSAPSDKMSSVKATSLLPDFQVFVKENAGYVTITGIRGLASTSSQILANTPLVEVSFVPKASGNLELSILQSMQNELTKFVDTETKLFYPNVASTSVDVQ